MKNKLKKIEREILSGNYDVERRSSCDCSVDNISEDYGVTLSGNECWIVKVLYIEGIGDVCEYIQFAGVHSLIDGISNSEIREILPDSVMDEIRVDDDDTNHDDDAMAAMIEQYFDDFPSAKYYRDDKRGFANEYCIIFSKNGKTEKKEEWEEISKEQAAEDIAYSGDPTTDAYNSVEIYD